VSPAFSPFGDRDFVNQDETRKKSTMRKFIASDKETMNIRNAMVDFYDCD
jgi:hypothetical protein